MNMDQRPDDPLLNLLSRLPAAAPDAARSARVLLRCRKALRARAQRQTRPGVMRRLVEPATVGAFVLLYAVALVHDVLRAYGLI